MKKIFFMPITILITLILFSLVVDAYPIVAGPSNYEGQQIQNVIDYLRSITLNASANNIQYYLDNGKIIIDDLPEAGKGVGGKSKYKGGPIIIDPSIFNPGIPKDKRKLWDPSNLGDLQSMILLASLLLHEKYHSEHHNWIDRTSGNTRHMLGGDNPFEFEGHMVAIGFVDEVIIKLMIKLMQQMEDPNISDNEKIKILERIKALISLKISRINDLDDNKYGPQVYNTTKLDEFKKMIDELIEELKKKTNQSTSIGTLKIMHDDLHSEANYKFAATMQRFDESAEKNSQDYAVKIFNIVKIIKRLDVNNPYVIEVRLNLDTPSDLETGIGIFYVRYGGQKVNLELLSIDDDPALIPDYTLIISESDLIDVYSYTNSNQRIIDLFENGKIEVSDNKPIGRQFEDPCGNGNLDRGEACDYGTPCPNNYVCSDTCICIRPGQGKELPPKEPTDEKAAMAETGPNTGIFSRLLSSLANLFKKKEVPRQTADKPIGSEGAPAESVSIEGTPTCPGRFRMEVTGKFRSENRCQDDDYEKSMDHFSDSCRDAGTKSADKCKTICSELGCLWKPDLDLFTNYCRDYNTPNLDKQAHIHYCELIDFCICEKENAKSTFTQKKDEKYPKTSEEKKSFFKNLFADIKKLFKIESDLFKIEKDTVKEPLEDVQEISDTDDTAPQQACSGNNQFEDSSCLNSCNPNQKCESDTQNPGCFRCNPVCANDEYYDDSGCGGLCTEGVNKCVQTSEEPPCYWCKPTCRIGEFYNDPNCGGLCFQYQQCALTNPEGPCYSCQPKAVAKAVEEKVTFKVTATEVTEDYVYISGTVQGASQIKYIRMTDLFKGSTKSYPVLFDKDRTKFTFKEKLELGKHFLTIEADLVSGERIRSEPITANVEQEEKCTGNNIYKDSNCLNACLRNQKCTAREYPAGCYGCESVCGAGEYYNDKDCAGQCTVGQTECTASNEKDCYWCQPLNSGYIYFEFKDIDQDYKQVQTLMYGHKMYFIVASNTFDVRKQLPITVTMTVSGEEVFKAKIPNEPELHCRDATGCSIPGPLIKSEWQGKPLYLKAYNNYNTILADFKQ